MVRTTFEAVDVQGAMSLMSPEIGASTNRRPAQKASMCEVITGNATVMRPNSESAAGRKTRVRALACVVMHELVK